MCEEGSGFKTMFYGMNIDKCLLVGEAVGLGYAALSKASKYTQEQVVFPRPTRQNQGIQHPLALANMHLEAVTLVIYHAAGLYDRLGKDESVTGHAVGLACNSAKCLSAETTFTTCERGLLAHGGIGYSQRYHVERCLR